MNRERRKTLTVFYEELSALRDKLEEVRDDEQNAFDSLPEAFHDGERGEKMQTAITEMEAAMDLIEEIQDNLENAKS